MRIAVVAFGVAVVGLSALAAPRRTAVGLDDRRPDRSTDQMAPGTLARIHGSVRDAASGQPIRRAMVILQFATGGERDEASQGRAPRSTTSDLQGQFEFAEVPAGRVTLSASKDGYFDPAVSWNGAPTGAARARPLPVAAGQLVEGVTITLARAGAIVGRVVDEFGDAAPNVELEVLRRERGTRGLLQTAGRRTESDDTGSFRAWGLAPGEYLVAARPRQVSVESKPSASADREGFAATYYPGTTNASDAVPVMVRAGRDTTGVSFALQSTRLAVIRGRVVGADGAAPGKVTVMVSRVDRERLGSGATGAATGPDGSFEVTRVPPGRYRLSARHGVDGPFGKLQGAGSAEVDVDGADVDGVVIPLAPGTTVHGRVIDEHGQPAGAGLQVQFAAGLADMTATPAPAPAVVAADGSFVATALFGRLHVRMMTGGPEPRPLDAMGGRGARPPGDAIARGVTALLVNGADMLDRPITFTGGRVEMVVEVSTRLAEVSGTVHWARTDRGTQARPVVVVFPDDAARWHEWSTSVRTSNVTADGTFAIRPVPPGERYLVVAVDGLPRGASSSPEVLTVLRRLARPLEVRRGERHDLTLSAVPWPPG